MKMVKNQQYPPRCPRSYWNRQSKSIHALVIFIPIKPRQLYITAVPYTDSLFELGWYEVSQLHYLSAWEGSQFEKPCQIIADRWFSLFD
jgi:hypothetical protein